MRRAAGLALALSCVAAQAVAQGHAGHNMPADAPPSSSVPSAEVDISQTPAPPAATDDLSEQFHSRAGMAAARAVLRAEHGGGRRPLTRIEMLEVRPGAGADGYAWEAAFRYGGDIHRLVLKTEGEGVSGHALEAGEAQALYSRAVGPYFDLQAGLRQDLPSGSRRTYATVGLAGLAPYWFEVESAAFLSNKGVISARVEASHDLRLTQRLILQPRVEATVAARGDAGSQEGAGLTRAEAGLRRATRSPASSRPILASIASVGSGARRPWRG